MIILQVDQAFNPIRYWLQLPPIPNPNPNPNPNQFSVKEELIFLDTENDKIT